MDDFKKSEVGTFEEELQALIDYGHDCCARIDDKIHEQCLRIKKAHDTEVGGYAIALGWKQEQDQLATTYDVLGNERHKAVCKLREMPDGYPKYSAFPFAKWYEDLSIALGINKGEFSCAKVRDTLIHLLGGDLKQAKLGDLYGIWKEEQDAMDAGRCGGTSSGGGVPAADKRRADCDDNQPSEGVAPITQELRNYLEAYKPAETDTCMEVARIGTLGYQGIMERLDAIDAVHANLERENAELRKRTMYPAESERINMLEREVKRLAAECKTQRNNFDQATSAREHWKSLYEQALEHIHDLERDYEVACHVNEKQEREYLEWYNKACHMQKEIDDLKEHHEWAPESHYMMLPKDSDGVPVRIGDVMEWPDTTTAEVVGVGNGTFFYVEVGENVVECSRTCDKIHHVQESVEDTLRDVVTLCHNTWKEGSAFEFYDVDDVMKSSNIAEYAAKLRMAESEDE